MYVPRTVPAAARLAEVVPLRPVGRGPSPARRGGSLSAFAVAGPDGVATDRASAGPGRAGADAEALEADVRRARARGDDGGLAGALAASAQARVERGEVVAARDRFEELVAVAQRLSDDGLVATGLVGLGVAAAAGGDHWLAECCLSDGAVLAAGSGHTRTRADATSAMGDLALLRGDPGKARAHYEDCIDQAGTAGSLARTLGLLGLGRVALAEGDPQTAGPRLREAAGTAGQAGLPRLRGAAVDGLGEAAALLGDAEGAGRAFEEALALARDGGDELGVARSTYHLAELARARGSWARAASLHLDALQRRHRLGDRAGVADSLEALAGLSVAAGDDERAARLFGAAQGVRDAAGCTRYVDRRPAYAADLARLHDRLPPSRLGRLWDDGGRLSEPEAVASAAGAHGRGVSPAVEPRSATAAGDGVATVVALVRPPG